MDSSSDKTTSTADRVFTPMAVLWMVAIGIFSFIAFLVLAAYAPDLRSGRDGRAHALSVSATGYKGLTQLISELGDETSLNEEGKASLVRNEAAARMAGFLIVTPEETIEASALAALVNARYKRSPTLIVLPKWRTVAASDNPGWVEERGMLNPETVSGLLKNIAAVTIDRYAAATARTVEEGNIPAAPLQSNAIQQRIKGSKLSPIIIDDTGRIVLAQIRGQSLYILAEPDLFNNLGLKNIETARAAIATLEEVGSGENVTFDLTLNGFSAKPNLLKMAFEPPFLALTLCLIAAALLAGLHGAYRFGAPRHEGRGIAFGKWALLDSSAGLMRAARREHRIGGRYAVLTRDVLASQVSAPTLLSELALIQFLDRLGGRDTNRYADLAARAASAGNRAEVLQAAQALYHWRKDRMRDRR